MSFINGDFPGKFILINREKANSKNLQALKEIYPTAIIILDRSELKEIKMIELIEKSKAQNTIFFSFNYQNNKKNNLEIFKSHMLISRENYNEEKALSIELDQEINYNIFDVNLGEL